MAHIISFVEFDLVFEGVLEVLLETELFED